jgi:hypothetical protein
MSLAQPIGSEAEPDFEPDAVTTLLTEMQMKHLLELRELAMDVARDVAAASSAATVKELHPDLAMARIGKLILQIVAMERHVAGERDQQRAAMKTARAQAKRGATAHGVRQALAAAKPKLPSAQREDLLRGVIVNYDFSDPRKVAQIVADMCRQLGVPPRPDLWPAGEAVAPVQDRAASGDGSVSEDQAVAPVAASGPASDKKPTASPGNRREETPPSVARANGRGPP